MSPWVLIAAAEKSNESSPSRKKFRTNFLIVLRRWDESASKALVAPPSMRNVLMWIEYTVGLLSDLCCNGILKLSIQRPRPAYNINDQTTQQISCSCGFFPKYRFAAAGLTFLVGLSRVAMGRHYLSDVLGGLAQQHVQAPSAGGESHISPRHLAHGYNEALLKAIHLISMSAYELRQRHYDVIFDARLPDTM
ncbi:PAP2 family protein [Ancylostoma ceylanicum]|uniref:PAP2 family protein n=1 Tax=Ancylostoma ceylanicum TaxID=53326 RepID=A0A0D6LNT2_9BILA|nr:PAP2 family protein [Ancylostoma ceylanicum]